ncbi:MAG: methylated-DNA--[protein]-cysteine S-methyltransferase [Pseudomonadota bacterium]
MLTTADESRDYARIERAIRYLEAHAGRQPGLGDVAAAVGLSPYHFQRLFTRWAGVSPKRFLGLLTVAHARRLLQSSASVLDAALAVGLSGPGRLHDQFVALEAATPGEVKTGGAGLEIRWGVHASPFGEVLVALTPRGVCRMAFLGAGDEAAERDALAAAWPGAAVRRDDAGTASVARAVFAGVPGPTPRLWVRGTNFQVAVWRALLRVPEGAVCTYGDLAAAIGRPGAARAVGQAVGANPVAYLIPCHRVIRGVGGLGGYRWGPERKRAMLAWEAARAPA